VNICPIIIGIGEEDFDFEDERMSPADLKRFQQRQRILLVLERASAYYVQNLMADPKAGPVRGKDLHIFVCYTLNVDFPRFFRVPHDEGYNTSDSVRF
jgi:hypothetical protein